MAFELGDMIVRIRQEGMEAVERQFQSLADVAGTSVKNIVALGRDMAAAFAFNELRQFAVESVKAAAEQEAALQRLTELVDHQNGSWGLTVERINAVATQLQNTTTFADDLGQKAAAALLAFDGIKGDMFEPAMQAAADLAAMLDKDLVSAAKAVGKALEEPEKAGKALSKFAIQFSEDEQQVIASMLELNKTGEAQALILAKLQAEAGGAAKAMGETFGGQIERAKNQWDELKETIGGTYLPLLEPVLGKLNEFLQALPEAFRSAGEAVGTVFEGLRINLENFIHALTELFKNPFGGWNFKWEKIGGGGDKQQQAPEGVKQLEPEEVERIRKADEAAAAERAKKRQQKQEREQYDPTTGGMLGALPARDPMREILANIADVRGDDGEGLAGEDFFTSARDGRERIRIRDRERQFRQAGESRWQGMVRRRRERDEAAAWAERGDESDEERNERIFREMGGDVEGVFGRPPDGERPRKRRKFDPQDIDPGFHPFGGFDPSRIDPGINPFGGGDRGAGGAQGEGPGGNSVVGVISQKLDAGLSALAEIKEAIIATGKGGARF